MQPLDRNASRVGSGRRGDARRRTASPVGRDPGDVEAGAGRAGGARGQRRRRDGRGRAAWREGSWPTPMSCRVAEDLGVAAQQACDEQGQERQHDCLDHHQDQHRHQDTETASRSSPAGDHRTPTDRRPAADFIPRSPEGDHRTTTNRRPPASGQSSACVEVGEEVGAGSRCPTESRTSAGSTASGESAAEAWVIRAGCSMSDSTAPSDSASVKSRGAGAPARAPRPPRRRRGS